MAYDFPASPTDGQVFTPPGGPIYVFSNPVWKIKTSTAESAIIVSDTAPSSPVTGQLWYESDSGALYVYYDDGNSKQWVMVAGPGGAQQNDYVKKAGDTMTGELVALSGQPMISNIVRTVFTSSGTYTKPAGLKFLEVEMVGAGGGGGGSAGTGASQYSAGGGGGAGGWARKLYTAASLSASEAYTVGAAGGNTSGNNPGGTGGGCSFKSQGVSGGGGGTGGAAIASGIGGSGSLGGSSSGGDVGFTGGLGGQGFVIPGALGGNGGVTMLGGGGRGGINGNGAVGTGYGGGGGGGAAGASAAAGASGFGTQGAIIITEYF